MELLEDDVVIVRLDVGHVLSWVEYAAILHDGVVEVRV